MEINKIIFLDIDGVLNYILWYIDDRNPGNLYGQEGDLDPFCIDRINKLCEETNSKIVISSDWRIDRGYKDRLELAGLKNIIGHTPITIFDTYDSIDHFTRGEEIQMYLKQHPNINKYVIIDDRTDFTNEQKQFFVKVNSYIGLTDENCELAKNILNN